MLSLIFSLPFKLAIGYILVAAGYYIALRKFNPSDIVEDSVARKVYGTQAFAMPIAMIGSVLGAIYVIGRIAFDQATAFVIRTIG